MKYIWAPWRMSYILSATQSNSDKTICILCAKPAEKCDEPNYILHRGMQNYIMLNAFPYNPGHLMVCPYRHINKLEDMTTEESIEHIELVQLGVRLLKLAVTPEGFNLGMNLGRVAGAGIEDHIHSHIVPRWNGDTSFMPVIADTKALPQGLDDTYKNLKANLRELIG